MCVDTLTDERQCGIGIRTLGENTSFSIPIFRVSGMAGERFFFVVVLKNFCLGMFMK